LSDGLLIYFERRRLSEWPDCGARQHRIAISRLTDIILCTTLNVDKGIEDLMGRCRLEAKNLGTIQMLGKLHPMLG